MEHKGCKHERFFCWVKEKMTPEDALYIKFGEKCKEFPAEMKKEFTELFNRKKELHKDKKAFKYKWEQYFPKEHDFSDDCHSGKGHDGCRGGW